MWQVHAPVLKMVQSVNSARNTIREGFAGVQAAVRTSTEGFSEELQLIVEGSNKTLTQGM